MGTSVPVPKAEKCVVEMFSILQITNVYGISVSASVSLEEDAKNKTNKLLK